MWRRSFLWFRKKYNFFRMRLKNDCFSLPVMCKREYKSYRKDEE